VESRDGYVTTTARSTESKGVGATRQRARTSSWRVGELSRAAREGDRAFQEPRRGLNFGNAGTNRHLRETLRQMISSMAQTARRACSIPRELKTQGCFQFTHHNTQKTNGRLTGWLTPSI